MRTLAVKPEMWSPRRWAATMVLLVVAQAGLLAMLSERSPTVAQRERPGFSARVISEPAAGAAVFDAFAVGDPTLLTLVHPQGFARGRPRPIAPEAPQLWDLSEAPRWLSQDQSRLGGAFAGFLRTNAVIPAVQAESPAPAPVAVPAGQPLLDQESSVTFEGELAGRELRAAGALPSWTNGELVTNTVVQVSVNAAGEVFAPRLARGAATSGVQHDADLYAVNWVRQQRFKPVPAPAAGRSIVIGRVIFHWRTVPPSDGGATGGTPPR